MRFTLHSAALEHGQIWNILLSCQSLTSSLHHLHHEVMTCFMTNTSLLKKAFNGKFKRSLGPYLMFTAYPHDVQLGHHIIQYVQLGQFMTNNGFNCKTLFPTAKAVKDKIIILDSLDCCDLEDGFHTTNRV